MLAVSDLRKLYGKFMSLNSLMRTFGAKEGCAIAIRLIRDDDPIQFSWGGKPYFIKRDGSVLFHLNHSLPVLQKLADQIDVDSQVIVDVGAHSGLFATLASRHAKSARVIAVEPEPQLWPVIERNLNSANDWHLVRKALADRCGTLTFFRNSMSSQTSSLVKSSVLAFTRSPEALNVEATTLTHLFEEFDLGEIDVLKIDVQGAESLVIDGGFDVLSRVKLLLIEISFLDNRPGELLTRLETLFGEPKIVNLVAGGADLAYRRGNA